MLKQVFITQCTQLESSPHYERAQKEDVAKLYRTSVGRMTNQACFMMFSNYPVILAR